MMKKKGLFHLGHWYWQKFKINFVFFLITLVVWGEAEARRGPLREVEPLRQVPKVQCHCFAKNICSKDLSLEKQSLGGAAFTSLGGIRPEM